MTTLVKMKIDQFDVGLMGPTESFLAEFKMGGEEKRIKRAKVNLVRQMKSEFNPFFLREIFDFFRGKIAGQVMGKVHIKLNEI